MEWQQKSWCECKKCHVFAKYYIWNRATYSCEKEKYISIMIMDVSVITCNEIIEFCDKEA